LFFQDAAAAPKETANGSNKMREILLEKQRELLELQEKKVALELLQTRAMLEGRSQPAGTISNVIK